MRLVSKGLLAVFLLILALPAVPPPVAGEKGPTGPQADAMRNTLGVSPPPMEAQQGEDEVLLEKLFEKSVRYHLAMPIFRLSNGSLETYIVGVRNGDVVDVFDPSGNLVLSRSTSGYDVLALFPGGPEKVYLATYDGAYLFQLTSSPWGLGSYYIGSFIRHVLVTDNTTYLITTTIDELRVYSVKESGPLLLFSENHGLLAYSPGTYYFHPAAKQDGTIVQVLSNHLVANNQSTKIWVARVDLEGDTLSMDSYDIGNATEVKYATIYMALPDTRYADMAYPWLAGLSPMSGKLYLVNVAEGTLETLDLWSLLGAELDSPWLGAAEIGGEQRFIIAGVDSTSGSPGVPLVAVLDPETGSLVDVYRLEGFPTFGLKAELAPYGGVEALYLLVHHYIVILDTATMSVIAAVESNISNPLAIAYGEHNGVGIVVASGYNENDQIISEFYSVGGIAEVARTELKAPDQAYAGEPFTVNVTLLDYKDDPIPGKTVVVEELTNEGWTPIASGTTDSDGRATITVTLTGRGERLLRAHYSGGDGYTAAYSRPVRVILYEKVHLTITVEPETTIEGVPATAVVYVERESGAPIGGVWVRVLANVSGTWAVVGTGMTGDNGLATVPINLYAGTYMLVAEPVTPYLEITQNNSAILKVEIPLSPPPEGPYVAPVGRVLAFAPPMAEKGEPAAVVFAFYYGENVLEPESVSVVISPAEDYTLEEVQAGVYRVVFTPSQTGPYTVVFTAVFNGASYVGAASFYVYNVMERMNDWEAQIEEFLDSLLELNETITSYLEIINESLQNLNITKLQAMVEMIGENTSLILVRLEAINESLEYSASNIISIIEQDLENSTDTLQALILANWMEIRGLNETLAEVAESLNTSIENVRILVASNGEILAVLNTSVRSLEAMLERTNATIVGEIRSTSNKTYYLINTSTGTILASLDIEIRGLNETLAEVAESLNTSIENARVIVTRNGELLAALNTSIRDLAVALERANASLIGAIKDAESNIIYVINTSTGTILADTGTIRGVLNTLGYTLSLVNETTLRIDSSLGNLNTSISTALNQLGLLAGKLENLTTTTKGVLAEVRSANGTITRILLDELNPRIEDVREEVALLNTSIGYIIANLTTAQQAISLLQDSLQSSLDNLNTKLDAIQDALDQVNTKLDQAPTQDELRQVDEKAGHARTIALAGIGTSIASLGAALALTRRL